jgi:drug/metabolite transporter superfamily protein YnfA
MSKLKSCLVSPHQAPGLGRTLAVLWVLALAGLMLLAGVSKLAMALEGPTKPPEHWNWQPDWEWPPKKWEWPPKGGWFRNAEGKLVDRESGKVWPDAPFVVMPGGQVIDATTLQPPPRSGIDRAALVQVVHNSLRHWLPVPPIVMLVGVAVLELLLGVLMLVARRRKPVVAVAMAVMVALFSVVMMMASPELAGRDCACFGGLLDSQSLWVNLLRNAAMVAGAMMVAFAWVPKAGVGQAGKGSGA